MICAFLSSCGLDSFLQGGIDGVGGQAPSIEQPDLDDDVYEEDSNLPMPSYPGYEDNNNPGDQITQYYTITYDYNDDLNTTFTIQVKEGNNALEYNGSSVSKKGYLFVGWTYNNGTLYDFTLPVHSDIKLFGSWVVDPNYDLNASVSYEAIIYFNDDKNRVDTYYVKAGDNLSFVNPNYVIKENYVFSHFADANGNVYDLNTPIYSNTFIYACWISNEASVNVFIDFNYNDKIETRSIKEGEFISEPYIDKNGKYGHTFIGWYTSNGDKFDFKKPIYDDTFVYAKWEVTQCRITFNTNGSIDYYEDMNIAFGEIFALPYPSEPEGYYFECWKDQYGNTYSTELMKITKSMDLTAVFNPHQYWINLNVCDGYVDWWGNSVSYNSSFTLPKPTHYNGNKFKYWVDAYGNIYNAYQNYIYSYPYEMEFYAIFEDGVEFIVIQDIYQGREVYTFNGEMYFGLWERYNEGKRATSYIDQNGKVYQCGEYCFTTSTFLTPIYEEISYKVTLYAEGVYIDTYTVRQYDTLYLDSYINGKYVSYYTDQYGNTYYDSIYYWYDYDIQLYAHFSK